MSDILDRKIAAMMDHGQRLHFIGTLTEQEVRDGYEFQLQQLSRLTSALDILFPDRPRAGVSSIPAAIDKLEEMKEIYDAAMKLHDVQCSALDECDFDDGRHAIECDVTGAQSDLERLCMRVR